MGGDRKETDEKKKYLKWWIAAISAVFIVGAGIFVYTQYKAAQTSGDVATKDGTSASASDITWNGKTYSYNEHLSNFCSSVLIQKKRQRQNRSGRRRAGGRVVSSVMESAGRRYYSDQHSERYDDSDRNVRWAEKVSERAKIISVYLMHTVTADMKAVSWRKMQFRIALRTADRRVLCFEYGWTSCFDRQRRRRNSNRAERQSGGS